MDLTGKVALVTGAGRSTGMAIAKALLQAGAAVIATDLEAPSWEVESGEDRLTRAAMDVSSEEQVESLVDKINRQTTGINVLVNNAAIYQWALLPDMTLNDWERMFAVNCTGTFLCTRAVVRNLLANKAPGSIINIASVGGKNAFPSQSHYCASKAAVIGFTRSLAVELGPAGIRVNAICPGSIDTPMLSRVAEDIAENTGQPLEQVKKSMVMSIPLRRLQEPEDVARLALFLASDDAANINGESINLDGGMVRD
jgi:NAD(P)-dependent dehydrogenase (short-subunit alcohol dehydrogenase family)